MKAVKKQTSSLEENPSSESIKEMFIRRNFDAFKDVTSIFRDIFTSPMGIAYMMLFIIMFNVGVSRAAAIPDQDNFLSTNALSRLQTDQDMIIFDTTSIDTRVFLFDLGEVNHGIDIGINIAINAMKKQCALHPENCQAV